MVIDGRADTDLFVEPADVVGGEFLDVPGDDEIEGADPGHIEAIEVDIAGRDADAFRVNRTGAIATDVGGQVLGGYERAVGNPEDVRVVELSDDARSNGSDPEADDDAATDEGGRTTSDGTAVEEESGEGREGADSAHRPPEEPPEGPRPPENGDGGTSGEWDNPRHSRLVAPLRLFEGLSLDTMPPNQAAFVRANITVVREAQAAGVEIIDSSGVPEGEVEAQTADPEVYNTTPSRDFTVERERAMAQELAAQGKIQVPATRRLIDTSYDDLRTKLREEGPFVLVRTDLELGQGKYLIDTPRQVDTLGLLLEAEDNFPLLERLAVTDFVPTPSDRYTSYKAISNPNGDVVAASLLYSPHTKNAVEHRLNKLDSVRGVNDILRVLFEHPDSSAYLGAKNVGSYAGAGSEEIALMGTYAGQLRPGEADILEEHGIDPGHPTVPEDIISQVSNLRPITRLAGLASSVDFIQSEVTGQRFYLETNSGPGPNTYSICWFGDPAYPDGFTAMLRATAQKLLKG